MKIVAYLAFEGNTQEVIHFYENVFDSKADVMTFGDAPPSEDMPEMTPEQKKMVMHAELAIGDSFLYFSDNMPGYPFNRAIGDTISLTAAGLTVAEAESIFAKLSQGGQIVMPLEKSFWSPAFGTIADKFGITWQISAE